MPKRMRKINLINATLKLMMLCINSAKNTYQSIIQTREFNKPNILLNFLALEI